MKLTRFEFNGIGIFQQMGILYELPLEFSEEEDIRWAEKQFEKTLEVPDVLTDQKELGNLYSFFTDLGLKSFEDCLDVILNAYYEAEDAGRGKTVAFSTDSDNLKIVYQDDYQVVAEVSGDVLNNLRYQVS